MTHTKNLMQSLHAISSRDGDTERALSVLSGTYRAVGSDHARHGKGKKSDACRVTAK